MSAILEASHQLPPFLTPFHRQSHRNHHGHYIDAIFTHTPPASPVHALWWPPVDPNPVETVLFFIPGNPGLLEFYIPFLSALHQEVQSGSLAVLAHSHIGHTPDVPALDDTATSLLLQVESAIQAFDSVVNAFGKKTRIILIGHSVGSWIGLQVLKARPTSVAAEILLCPTISNIGSTPKGRRLSWMFNPFPRRLISLFTHLAPLIPERLFTSLLPSWPLSQVRVLIPFIRSWGAVNSSLVMAYHEMQTIKDLDVSLLVSNATRLYFFYAEVDDWVGTQRELVLNELNGNFCGGIIPEQAGVPHAFCIDDWRLVATTCTEWIVQILKSP